MAFSSDTVADHLFQFVQVSTIVSVETTFATLTTLGALDDSSASSQVAVSSGSGGDVVS